LVVYFLQKIVKVLHDEIRRRRIGGTIPDHEILLQTRIFDFGELALHLQVLKQLQLFLQTKKIKKIKKKKRKRKNKKRKKQNQKILKKRSELLRKQQMY